MKIITLVFLSLLLSLSLCSQSRKLAIGVEYATVYSKVTDPTFAIFRDYNDMKVGHNLFIKTSYGITKNTNFTSGIGFMLTRRYIVSYLNGQSNINWIQNFRYQDYIVVPVGFEYHFNSIVINPEIGIGLNYSSRQTNIIRYTDHTIETKKIKDKNNTLNIHKLFIPVLCSISKEFYLKVTTLTLGIHGYYGLSEFDKNNDGPNRLLGFGFKAGVWF